MVSSAGGVTNSLTHRIDTPPNVSVRRLPPARVQFAKPNRLRALTFSFDLPDCLDVGIDFAPV